MRPGKLCAAAGSNESSSKDGQKIIDLGEAGVISLPVSPGCELVPCKLEFPLGLVLEEKQEEREERRVVVAEVTGENAAKAQVK